MAELPGCGATWGSVLSVDAFTAIRSVAFEPVGQVFGAAVYPLTATAGVSCPRGSARHLVRDMSARAADMRLGAVSGQGIPGPAARGRASALPQALDGDRPDGR